MEEELDSKLFLSFDEVENLLLEYGVHPEEISEDIIKPFLLKIRKNEKVNYLQKEIEELDLKLFLLSCKEGNLTIKGTVDNPIGGEIKNQEKVIKFSSWHLGSLLKDQLPNYSIEELLERRQNSIKAQKRIDKLNENERSFLGTQLNTLDFFMKNDEIFDEWKDTKYYSFMYDLCALSGVVENIGFDYTGENAKKKVKWIKYRLKTYSDWWNWFIDDLSQGLEKGKKEGKK